MAKTPKKKTATPRKPTPKAADSEIAKKRAKAYSDKRRKLMQAWATYCERRNRNNIVPLARLLSPMMTTLN